MTSLAAFNSVDQRGTSAIYFISDSRITWGDNSKWDFGRKLFSSSKYPDVLCYCGDVVFPSLVLAQVISLIDAEILFNSKDDALTKNNKIFDVISSSFSKYPDLFRKDFSILHCSREGQNMGSRFYVWQIYPKNKTLQSNKLVVPSKSALIVSLGSGKKYIDKYVRKWWVNSDSAGTSRGVYCGIWESINKCEDPNTGGLPQLVGLLRKGPGRVFGIIKNNEPSVLGIPVNSGENLGKIEWRNELFEICDGITMQKLSKAQKHAVPRFKFNE